MSGDSEPQKSQEPQPIESMCEGNNEPVATTPIIDGKSDDKEARKAAFKEFIKSIPRTCSTTICGTVGCPSPGISRVDADCSEEWHTQEFNWSIDQIAILNPCDISLDEQFNGELTNLLDSSLERENEQFFEQLEILPSPAFCRLNLTPGDGQGSFLTPFTRLPPGNRSTPYQPCTPPPTRSASRTARLSSASSTTPYSSIKTKNKKKLFNDNQDDIFEDSESNVPMCSIDPETAPFSLSLSSP